MSHHRDTQQSLLSQIATNTKNINVNVDSLEVNTDGLEALQTTANSLQTTANNATLRDINNTSAIGDGSSNATSVCLGYDRSGGQGRALKVDASGNLDVNVVSMTGGGDATAANQTTMIGHLSTIEGDTTSIDSKITACNTGAVVVSSSSLPTGASTSALQGAGLPSALSNDNLKVSIQEGNITGFATESTLSAAEVHLGAIDTNIVNAEAHLGNIDTGIDVLEACVGSNKVNVNISSGNITGFATESTLSAAEVHLGAIDTNIVNAEAHLGTIDTNIASVKTAVELLDNAVDGSSLNVNLNIQGNDVDSNSGNKSANSQRVVIATDDVNVSAIKTSVDKISRGYDSQIASGGNGLQQVLAYGRDAGGNLDALNVDNNGHLKVISAVVEIKGSEGNVLSNNSLSNLTATSSINVSDFNKLVYMYEDSNTGNSNGIRIEVSEDNSRFYVHSEFYPVVYGSVRQSVGNPALDMNGIKYLRFNNHNSGASNDLTNVYISVLGTPN